MVLSEIPQIAETVNADRALSVFQGRVLYVHFLFSLSHGPRREHSVTAVALSTCRNLTEAAAPLGDASQMILLGTNFRRFHATLKHKKLYFLGKSEGKSKLTFDDQKKKFLVSWKDYNF